MGSVLRKMALGLAYFQTHTFSPVRIFQPPFHTYILFHPSSIELLSRTLEICRHMEYRRAWSLIYATFLHVRIFGVLTRISDTCTEHQVLIPSENVTKNLTV